MPFEKGNKLSPGRPPGSTNKKTNEWNKLGEYITKTGAEKIMEYLMTLEGEELFDKYERLLNYFKPKHASTTLQAEIEIPALNLNLRSEDAIEAMKKLTAQDDNIDDAEIIEE